LRESAGERQCCKGYKLDQDDLDIQQFYLEALVRVETRAAEVAFELGLGSLGSRIRDDVRAVERAILALAEARAADAAER